MELTTEQILLLEPGVEIRKLICEAIGWQQRSNTLWIEPKKFQLCVLDAPFENESYRWFRPDLDHNDTQEVVNWWQKRSGSVISVKWGLVETEVKVAAPDWTAWYVATAQTLPLAVCRAVLLAAKECK